MGNRFQHVVSAVLLVSASSFGLAAPALAQAAAEETSGLGEILVTANKREENLQETPLSITAVAAEQLELRGISEVKDISSIAPNVTVLQGTTNATAAVVTIRGIPTSGDESMGFDSPIGIYQDGVYLARSAASSSEVADIERVEVLRGPQGTLFGRNTTGGAVNFISREPGHDAMVKLRAGYGNYNLVQLRGVFDTGDIADGLRMSFGAVYKRRNGTVDNLLQPKDSRDPGSYKMSGFRWAAVLEPNDTIKITNIFDYTTVKGVIPASQFAAAGSGVSRGQTTIDGGVFNLVSPAGVGPFLAQSTTRILEAGCPKVATLARQDEICSEGAARYTDRTYGNLLRVEADMGAVTLRSSSAGRWWKNIQTGTDLDGLGTINGAALGPSSTTLNGFPVSTLLALQFPSGTANFLSSQPVFTSNVSLFQTVNNRSQSQFSQELELLSNSKGAFQWVLGGFFFTEQGKEVNPQSFGFILDTNAAVYNSTNFGLAAPLLQATNPARYRAVLQNSTLGYRASGKSYAVYGQASYRPGGEDGAFGITFGMRYTWDKKKFDRFQNGPTPFSAASDIDANRKNANFSAPTGNLTLDYRASDDVNLYARVARGYRSGGFNARQPIANAALPLTPFDNEVIWSYEAGFKTEFDRRIRLNGAVFYNIYSDLQVAVPVPIQGTASFGNVTANAGKVNYYGFELEGLFKLNDIFSIDGNVGYTKKKTKEYFTLDDSTPKKEVNIASVIKNSYSPDWTATIAANARFPLGDEGSVTARVGYNYTSDFILFSNPITAPFQKETNGDSRGLVEAQLKFAGLKLGNSNALGLTVWAKNLTNEKYVVRSVDFGQLGYAYTVYGEPRTFGATLDLEF